MNEEKSINALVVGGNSGLGLAMVLQLINEGYSKIYIVGKDYPKDEDVGKDYIKKFKEKCIPIKANLIDCNYSIFDEIKDLYLNGLNFHYVKTIKDVIDFALLPEKVDDAIEL